VTTQSEATLEKCLMDKLMDGGYERVKISDEYGLKDNLKSQIERFNKIELTDDEFNKILLHLESGTIFDKAKKLRDKYAIKREDEVIYVDFFQFKRTTKNIFIPVSARHQNRRSK